VFRRTFLKTNETAEEKKARLLRSLNALKACNTGKPSDLSMMKREDPLDIDYYNGEGNPDAACDVTETEIIVLNKGKVKPEMLS
jgi:hypothetical protein